MSCSNELLAKQDSSGTVNMCVTIILLACVILIVIKLITRRPARFPPGPLALPIMGSHPFLPGEGAEKYVSEKITSYGPVTGLYSGTYPLIVINDWKMAKSLFAREEFSGRIRYKS